MKYLEHNLIPIDVKNVPTYPVWAQSITVEQTGDTLTIYGKGRVALHEVPRKLTEGRADLMAKYQDYVRHAYKPGVADLPPHLEFANAGSDSGLLNFFRQYGPVWGTFEITDVQFLNDIYIQQIVAKESLSGARVEQQRFGHAFKLLATLQSDVSEKEAASVANALKGLENYDPANEAPRGLLPLMEEISMEAHSGMLDQDWAKVFRAGHAGICLLLDRFRPILCPLENGAIELPERNPEGILPALYYMLRKDYLSGRQIKFCDYPKCRKAFRVTRQNARFCGPECAQKQCQAEYWVRSGKKRRSLRLREQLRVSTSQPKKVQ